MFEIIFPVHQAVLLCHPPLTLSLELAGTKYYMQKPAIEYIWHHIFSYNRSRPSRSLSRSTVVLRQYYQIILYNSQILENAIFSCPLMTGMTMLCCWLFRIMINDYFFTVALTRRTRSDWKLSRSAENSWGGVASRTIPLTCWTCWASGTLCQSSLLIICFLLDKSLTFALIDCTK